MKNFSSGQFYLPQGQVDLLLWCLGSQVVNFTTHA